MKKLLLISLLLLFSSACQTLSKPEDTLYVELGGAEGVWFARISKTAT